MKICPEETLLKAIVMDEDLLDFSVKKTELLFIHDTNIISVNN